MSFWNAARPTSHGRLQENRETGYLYGDTSDCGGRGYGETSNDHEQMQQLLELLRSEGVPQGLWLVEIAQVRSALQSADSLLRRMQDAIIASMEPPKP